jgi:uncharacterized phage protein (TIGR02218 family)
MIEVRNFSSPYNSSSLLNHLDSSETNLTLFGKITPPAFWGGSANAVGFTANTRDIYLSNHLITFQSAPGILPSVIESSTGSENSNLENTIFFDHAGITEIDLEAGKWDYAACELWLMNWKVLAMGELVIFSGNFGEMHNLQTFFKVQAEGKHSALQNSFGEITSRLCRVKEFRDAQCGHTATTTTDGFSVSKTLTVSSVTNKYNLKFTRSSENVPDDFYTNGKITALSGANAGLSREISVGTGVGTGFVNIALKRAFPFPISASQTFTLVAGCDRTLDRCVYFDRVASRRAEDWIPGLENAYRVPPASN